MKSTELRIGNWVTIKNYVDFDWRLRPKECQVNMFDLNNRIRYHWNGSGEEYYYKLEDCEPIPLTEEWLLKFGFNEVFMVDGVWGHGIDGFIYVNNGQIRFKGKAVLIDENRLQHVHQLQNLYFALTGEELTIKEQ
jgi:hypothetical protein